MTRKRYLFQIPTFNLSIFSIVISAAIAFIQYGCSGAQNVADDFKRAANSASGAISSYTSESLIVKIPEAIKWLDGENYTLILNDGTTKSYKVTGLLLEKGDGR